jgi:hypothetical protein
MCQEKEGGEGKALRRELNLDVIAARYGSLSPAFKRQLYGAMERLVTEDVPAMIQEIRRLRKMLASVREINDEVMTAIEEWQDL